MPNNDLMNAFMQINPPPQQIQPNQYGMVQGDIQPNVPNPNNLIEQPTKPIPQKNYETGLIDNLAPSSLNPPPQQSAQLKQYDTGTAVKELQGQLTNQGFYSEAVDGDFGPKTNKAVRNFQKDKGLKQDGIVGEETKAVMDVLQPPVKSKGSMRGDEFPGASLVVDPIEVSTNQKLKEEFNNWGGYNLNLEGSEDPQKDAGQLPELAQAIQSSTKTETQPLMPPSNRAEEIQQYERAQRMENLVQPDENVLEQSKQGEQPKKFKGVEEVIDIGSGFYDPLSGNVLDKDSGNVIRKASEEEARYIMETGELTQPKIEQEQGGQGQVQPTQNDIQQNAIQQAQEMFAPSSAPLTPAQLAQMGESQVGSQQLTPDQLTQALQPNQKIQPAQIKKLKESPTLKQQQYQAPLTGAEDITGDMPDKVGAFEGAMAKTGMFLKQPAVRQAMSEFAVALDPQGFGGRLGQMNIQQTQSEQYQNFLSRLKAGEKLEDIKGLDVASLSPELKQKAIAEAKVSPLDEAQTRLAGAKAGMLEKEIENYMSPQEEYAYKGVLENMKSQGGGGKERFTQEKSLFERGWKHINQMLADKYQPDMIQTPDGKIIFQWDRPEMVMQERNQMLSQFIQLSRLNPVWLSTVVSTLPPSPEKGGEDKDNRPTL